MCKSLLNTATQHEQQFWGLVSLSATRLEARGKLFVVRGKSFSGRGRQQLNPIFGYFEDIQGIFLLRYLNSFEHKQMPNLLQVNVTYFAFFQSQV